MGDSLDLEIGGFLDLYREAFDRLDGEAIADLYTVPSGIISGGVHVHWTTRSQIVANMRRLCATYENTGYQRALCRSYDLTPLGPDTAFANVHWEIQRSAPHSTVMFRTAYNLVRSKDCWRVVLCTAYEEEPDPPIP